MSSQIGPRTDLVGFANSGQVNVAQLFVKNVPLASVATTGSASDLTKGVLPVAGVPPLDASIITTGQFPTAVLPASAQAASNKTDVWSGFNSNALSGTSAAPLGAGAYLGWNRLGTGSTGFANIVSSSATAGGWEFVSYNADKSFKAVSASISAAGAVLASSIGNGGAGLAVTDTLALGGRAITGVASLANAGSGITIAENVAMGGKALTGVSALSNGGSAISVAAALNLNGNAVTRVASLSNAGNGITINESVAFGGKTLSGVAVLGNGGSGVTVNDSLALAGGSLTGVGSMSLSQNLVVVNTALTAGTGLGVVFGSSSTAAGGLTYTPSAATGGTVALTNGGPSAPGLRIVPSGALTAMGTGYLLMRAFDVSAAVAAGTAPQFRGLPVDCQLVSAVSQGESSAISVGPPNYPAVTANVQLRFSGYVRAPSAGSYSLQLNYQGSARLWVNGAVLIDAYTASANPTASGSTTAATTLPAAWVPVMLEFFSGASGGRVGLRVLQSGNYVPLASVLGLAYDMYENPGTQFGTSNFLNGVITARLSNGGQGITVPEPVAFGGNALTGVASIANGGNGLTVSEATNFGGRALSGVASLANSGAGIASSEPLSLGGAITSSSILSFGQPASSPCLVSLFATGLPTRATTAFYGFGIGTNALAYRVPSSTQDHVFYAGTTEVGRIKGTGGLAVGTITNNGSGLTIAENVAFGGKALSGVASLANGGAGISIPESVAFGGKGLTGVASLANGGNGVSVPENLNLGSHALSGVLSIANGGNGLTVSESITMGGRSILGVASLTNAGNGISVGEAVDFGAHALKGVASLANGGSGISVSENVAFGGNALTGVASLANGGSGVTLAENVSFGGKALSRVASVANGGSGISIPETVNLGTHGITGVSSLGNGGAGIAVYETLNLSGSAITAIAQLDNAGSGVTVNDTLAVAGSASLTSVSASGNASVTGTLTVTGTSSVSSLTASGSVSSASLTVSGSSTLGSLSCSTLTTSGNATVGGTFRSTGAATLSSTLSVTGASTLASVGCTSVSASGTLAVSGTSTLTGNTVVGATTASSTSVLVQTSQTGAASVGMDASYSYGASMGINSNSSKLGWCVGAGMGTYAAGSALMVLNAAAQLGINTTSPGFTCDVNGTLRAAGAAQMQTTLTVVGASTLAGATCTALTVNGNGTVSGTLGVSGATTLSTLNVTGASTLAGASCTTLSASGNATLNGTLSVTGSSTLSGGLTVTGTSSLAAASCSTLTTTSTASVGGTLTVTGRLTVNNSVTVAGGPAGGAGNRLQITGGGSSGATTGIDLSTYAGGGAPCFSLTATDLGNGIDVLDLLQFTGSGSTQASRLRVLGNGNIGLGGQTNPQATLDVTGGGNFTGSLGVAGASTLASATLSGTLSVTGGSTLAGTTCSTLTVTGATTFSTVTVTGNTTTAALSASSLTVTGSATLAGATCSTLGASGNTTVGGTLGVTGGVSLSSTLSVTGATTVGALTASGSATLNGTLNVGGTSTLAGVTCTALTINGNGTVSGTLGVSGATTLSSTLNVTGATTLAGASCTTLSASGNATLSGTLSVTGSSNLSGGLTVTGTSSLAAASCSTLTTTSTASVGGTLTVAGRLTVNNSVTVAGGPGGGAGNRLQLTAGGSSGATTGIDLSTYTGGPAPCFSLTATDLGNGIDVLDLLQFTGSGSTQASRLRVSGNGNVGLGGQTNPQATLDVTGGGNFTGSLGVAGTSTLASATLSGTLSVTGGSTMAGATCSTLTVTGATTLSTVTVTGNTTAAALSASSLTVTGSSVLAGVTCSTLGASGNTTVGGTLGVTGGASLSSSLSVTGATTVAALTASGSATLNGALTVAGTATLSNALSVVGTSTLASATASTLTVTGATTLGGKLTVNNMAVVSGGVAAGAGYRMQVFGAGSPGSTSGLDLSSFSASAGQASGFSVTVTDVNNNQNSLDLLQCTGPGTAQANRLHVHGSNGNIGLGGQTNPQYTLDVTGNGNFSGNLTVGGNLVFSSLNLSGTLSVSGSTTLAAATCTSLGVTGLATMASAVCQGVLKFQQVQNQVVCLYTNDSGGAASSTSTNFFGLGTGSQALRYQVPSSASWHAWYSGATETMRLTATGLGISTQSPAFTLDVAGPARATQVLVGTSTDASSQRAVSALQSGLPAGGATYITLGQSTSTNNQAEMAFNYAGSGSTSNTLSLGFYGAPLTAGRLFFTAGGQLGVGTAAPAATCDVNGTLRASGAATLSSTLTVAGGTTLAGATVNGALSVTGTVQSTGTLTVTGGTAAGPGPRVQVLGFGGGGSTTGIDLSTYPTAPAPCFSLTATDLGNGTDSLDLLQFTGTGTTQASRLRVSGTGNIGLGGQLSPAYPLDVTGVVRATQLVGLFSGENRNDPLDQSVVLQYTFRAGSGTTVLDKTASLNNGTVSGNFTLSSANPFDGLRGTYLALADGSAAVVPSSPIGSATITASCWYSPGTLGNQGAYAVLFCNGPNLNMLCVRASDYQVGLYNNAFFGSGVTLTAGSWYHLAVTVYVVGSTVLTAVYVNSRQVMASTSGCNPAIYPITCVGNTGAGNTASTGQAATGRLADVRVWSRTLSTGEMEMVYSQSVKPVYRDVNTGFVGVNLTAPYGPPQYAVDVNGSVRASAAGSFGGALTVTGSSTLSGGASVTGAVTATSPSRFPQLLVGTSADTDTSKLVSALQSGLATGVTVSYSLGQAATTNNQAELGFLYNGSGSTANTCSIGFWGSAVTNRLWYTAAGNLGLGVQAPSYALDAVVPSTTGASCVARFGSNSTGISLTQSYPQVCFNSYFNGAGNAAMATGWSSVIDTNPNNGVLTIRTSAASASANALPTMNAAVVVDPSGKVGVFKTPTVALDVLGACKTSADTVLNTAAIGSLGYGNWAGLMYSGLPTTGYAVLQSAGGLTLVNNVAGQGVCFRDSNVTGMTYTNATLRVGDASLPSQTLDVAGIARANQILVGTSTDSTSQRAISALNSALTAGGSTYITLGQGAATNNEAEFCFNYAGAGSASNTLSLGFYNAATRLWYTAGGLLGVNNATPASTCDVAGSFRATGRVAMERSDDPIDNGSVLQYTFREGSGALVNDRSVSGNNGTLSGTYTWSGMGTYDGLRGAYISFTDTTGLLTLANSVASAYQTVSLWYNPSSAATGYTVLVWSAPNHNLLTFNISDMTLGFYNGSITSSGITLAFGQWYHICVVTGAPGGTPSWSLFVNGRSVYSASGSAVYSTATYPTSAVGNFPGGGQVAQGKYEDVRIWARGLSAGEVASLYTKKANLFRDPATGVQAFMVTWTGGSIGGGNSKTQTITFPTSFGQTGAMVQVQVVGTPFLCSAPSSVTATNFVVTLGNPTQNTTVTPTSLMIYATLGSPSSVPNATF